MTISIKHKFVNPKSDTADTTVSRASNWNDEHDITLAQNRVLGRVSAANGPVEELTGDQIRTISDTTQAGVLVGINTRTASYTLVASDRGKIVEMNVASANTVTVPNETGIGGVNYPIGTQIKITQFGTGQTTLLAAAGVTVRSVTGGLSTRSRYGGLVLYKRASNDWFVVDQTSAFLDGRIEAITDFADVYQAAAASDPTLRADSTALQTGDLYFNTTNDRMRVYETGTGWIDYEATAQTAATTATTQASTATTKASEAAASAVAAASSATTVTALDPSYRGFAVYVDSVSGNDANAGTTSAAPVKTIAQALTLVSGNTSPEIYLKRASVFREQFQLPNGCKVMSYGPATSPKPIVSGADLLSNASFSLTSGQTYTYQISLPSIASTTNPYVSVTNSDVLMVWENNTRLGYTFNQSGYTRPTSIANVEATAGSFWWDSTNKILYIHPADNSNPTSNGKVYEATVRTLAIHGGDNIYVDSIDAEKAGAKISSGQQGYAILGYKSGIYRNCTGKYGWNHIIGVANDVIAGTLTFEYCVAEDCERQTTNAPTLFIAYKSGSKPSRVIFKDCLAKQPSFWSGDGSFSECGFFAHGDGIICEYQGWISSINTRYGAQLVRDGTTDRTSNIVNCRWVFEACVTGLLIASSAENNHNIILFGKNNTLALQTTRNAYISGKVIVEGTQTAVIANIADGVAVSVKVRDMLFLRATAASLQGDGTAVAANNALATFDIKRCLFHNLGCAIRGIESAPVTASDQNAFSSCVRIYSDTNYTPGYGTTLAGWQSVSGFDANSSSATQTVPFSDFRFPSDPRPDLAMLI